MSEIVVVNASKVLADAEAAQVVGALQVWDDTMLVPAWSFDPCKYSFDTWTNFQTAAPDPNVWPIFLNSHSLDPTVGGYHDDQSGLIYGRIFVGDAEREGVSWTVDLSHEAAEMRGNAKLDQFVTLRDGRLALRELCDPVEDDGLGIPVEGVLLSDFVLPSYFSGGEGPWDQGGHLKGPCPTITTGGYQSIYEGGQWSQVTALVARPSWRSVRWHSSLRRQKLALISLPGSTAP